MAAPVFVDINVFIYAVDEADPKKQEVARAWRAELWMSRRARISFQVLQEFYVKVTQNGHVRAGPGKRKCGDLLAWRPVVLDEDIVAEGWKIEDRYRLSFWDALIVAAAKSASCRFLLTEDLQADQDLSGLVVINPFTRNPGSLP